MREVEERSKSLLIDAACPSQTTAAEPEHDVTHESSSFARTTATAILLTLISGITAICYRPVIFNWLSSDDFPPLEQLMHEPIRFLKNFYTPYMQQKLVLFYRPIYGVSQYLDWVVWRNNWTGYHLTNLLLHLANTSLVFALAKQIDPRRIENSKYWWTFPALAAALFGLHPLHPEVVSWVAGRVDAILTMFYLATIVFYLKARSTNNALWNRLSYGCFFLALGTKESAITIPMALLLCELILIPSERGTKHETPSAIARALRDTKLFWLTLCVYLVFRRVVLGTFIGGYDNSLQMPIEWLIARWGSVLRYVALPLNSLVGGQHEAIMSCWIAASVLMVACFLRHAASKQSRRPLFLFTWLVIALVPAYKVLAISPGLESSRHVYLASAILCLMASYAITIPFNLSYVIHSRLGTAAKACIGVMAVIASFNILTVNNQPYVEVGRQSNAVRTAAKALWARPKATDCFIIYGIPDEISGACLARNATKGLTNFMKCTVLNLDSYYEIERDMCKNLIRTNPDVKLCEWHPETGAFTPGVPEAALARNVGTSIKLN